MNEYYFLYNPRTAPLTFPIYILLWQLPVLCLDRLFDFEQGIIDLKNFKCKHH